MIGATEMMDGLFKTELLWLRAVMTGDEKDQVGVVVYCGVSRQTQKGNGASPHFAAMRPGAGGDGWMWVTKDQRIAVARSPEK